jgi:hypothetical protein
MTFAPAAIGMHASPWVVPLVLVFAAAAYFAYTRSTPPVAGALRRVLVALRTAALLALAVMLLDVRCVRTGEMQETAKVIALIDRSASMAQPDGAWGGPPGPTRFQAAQEAAAALEREVTRRGAAFRRAYFATDLAFARADTVRPDGQGTDIAGALAEAARRFDGEHVAALFLFSDGVDTEERMVRRSVPALPLFAVGYGDTTPPEDVRVSDVDYNSVVHVPSRATIRASLAHTGDRRRRVTLRLLEGEREVFARDTVLTPLSREIEVDVPVRFVEPGRREFRLVVDGDGFDAEPDNNARDVVIEGKKARAKIAIVDLHPGWEVHFLTDFLRRDQSFDFDLITASPPAALRGKRRPAPSFVAGLVDCDAVVLVSVDDEILSASACDALRRFVTERGGGLLVLPGEGSLFEHAAAWRRLSGVLPVQGSAPFRFTMQYASVLPGAQAAAHPVTAGLLPVLSQTEWQERSPLLGFYARLSAKRTGEVLLSVRGRSLPAVTYHTTGKGRAAVVSAGPLWRWKFLSDNNTIYDEMVSRMLDVLSRGEETDRFVLTTRKSVFEAGESPVVYAEIFNDKMQPVTGVPVRAEVSRVADDGTETPLTLISLARESAQSTRFRATLEPLPPGRYTIRGRAEDDGGGVASHPVEIRVSLTSVESQRVNQDRANLAGIARQSGGRTAAAANVVALAKRLPLEPRTVATTSETTLRASARFFLLVLGLLAAEWILRKRAGMI